jgi:hypothetical protein
MLENCALAGKRAMAEIELLQIFTCCCAGANSLQRRAAILEGSKPLPARPNQESSMTTLRASTTDRVARPILAAALASIALLATLAPASAWTRNGSVTTWRGTYAGTATGYCAYGTCQRSRTITGPNGGTVTRSGSATRTSPGVVQYGGTTTGPNGGTVTRSGTITRY